MNVQHEAIIRNLRVLRDLRLRVGQLDTREECGVNRELKDAIEGGLERLSVDAEEQLKEVRSNDSAIQR